MCRGVEYLVACGVGVGGGLNSMSMVIGQSLAALRGCYWKNVKNGWGVQQVLFDEPTPHASLSNKLRRASTKSKVQREKKTSSCNPKKTTTTQARGTRFPFSLVFFFCV
jgi:hypothetical protein